MATPTEATVNYKKSHPQTFHPLTTAQQEYFRRAAVARQQLETQMNGALQLIAFENGLQGKITLADDFTELIIEPQE